MPNEDASPEAAAVAPALEKSESETPEQREVRIAKLREEIAQGTYKPDARDLAGKIVDAHLKER